MAEEYSQLLAEVATKMCSEQFDNMYKFLEINKANIEVITAVQESNLIGLLAQYMNKNIRLASEPSCNYIYINGVANIVYQHMRGKISHDQTASLLCASKEWLSITVSGVVLYVLVNLASNVHSTLLLLHDSAIYDFMKRNLSTEHSECVISFFICATNYNEWKLKVMEDKQLLHYLLLAIEQTSSNSIIGVILFNLAQHPDAKVLLAREIIETASKCNVQYSVDICALLSNEADICSIKLEVEYISTRAKNLRKLLDGRFTFGREFFSDSLVDLLLPLVNLSIADANKDILGEHLIVLLLDIVSLQEDKPMIHYISDHLEQGKQGAAQTLWNLAFTTKNRIIIENEGGLEKLGSVLQSSKDELLLQNIEGILYMFEKPEPERTAKKLKIAQNEQKEQKHVLISYNWSHQPLVKKLARTLQQSGYRVWLDVEQMKGSTLESMASAVENADVMLLCMSQKYKDSPNCRLEGEYSVNRSIPVIPLMMQKDYKPDGWLGIILGSKLWYDFSEEVHWDVSVTELIRAIGDRGKGQLEENANRDTALSVVVKSPEEWSDSDLRTWMTEEGIVQHYDTFKAQDISGATLLEIKALFASDPHQTIRYLNENLKFSSVGTTLAITAALRRL